MGTLPPNSAQDVTPSSKNSDDKQQAVLLGLVRTINTIEVDELYKYRAYAQWPILLAHHREDFNGWLKRFYVSGDSNARFGDMPEILHGWNLRLNVQADGKGYILLLADASDKDGFAWVSDDSGIIRHCKYLA